MSRHPDLFKDIDSMEPDAFARHLSDDVRFTFGNAKTVVGRDNVRDVWAGFCETVDGVSHEIVEQARQRDGDRRMAAERGVVRPQPALEVGRLAEVVEGQRDLHGRASTCGRNSLD